MTREFSRPRRVAVALFALLSGALLFRPQLAGALVDRGDQYFYRGNLVQAQHRYRRALFVDPESEVAADRYVFSGMQLGSADTLQDAARVADHYLKIHPQDAALLADRGLCYLRLRRYEFAEADFTASAKLLHSAQYYVFAGWAARRERDNLRARSLWRAALAVQPGYAPALAALTGNRR